MKRSRKSLDGEQLLLEVLAHFPGMADCQSEEEMDSYLDCVRCADYRDCGGQGRKGHGVMDCMAQKLLQGKGWKSF